MLNETMQNKANRLANEKSPYLLQHAYNPVDWYPWGEEAFTKAKAEDKPIFLSIGYSTCHWCHVMERESFEDAEVAGILNDKFVAIKVDREERPDIDHIYMEVCQALTGQGGWPLTIFMTNEKKPFYAGTYFPKRDARGIPGLVSILSSISDYWCNKRSELYNSCEEILDVIKKGEHRESGYKISEDILKTAFKQYKDSFDSVYGGFNVAPKFPTPQNLYFLMRYWSLTDNETALGMVRKTLDAMYRGGIYDHIGFGFCRYATDKKWLVPHFEKMLYDNALLAVAYLEAYQATKSSEYGRVAEEIFTYILRDMTSSEGGFYSAEDADSEGSEGKFYVFSYKEIIEVLGDTAGEQYSEYYDITQEGNFENKNIANLIKTTLPPEAREFLENSREKLFRFRHGRVHPYKDDKILTGWNAMMIVAFSIGGRVLKKENYVEAASRAMNFILKKLVREDGRLMARYREGEVRNLAYIDDYAYVIWALIELYETTFETDYLDRAIAFTESMFKYFWDDREGGFFIYGSDGETLLTRPKEIYDGAIPSGNSVMAYNLLRLSRITSSIEYEEKAIEILNVFGKEIERYPMGYAFSLISLCFLKAKTTEAVLVDSENCDRRNYIKTIIYKDFQPFLNTLFINEGDNKLKKLIRGADNYKVVGGKTTVHICHGKACMEPTNDLEVLNQFSS